MSAYSQFHSPCPTDRTVPAKGSASPCPAARVGTGAEGWKPAERCCRAPRAPAVPLMGDPGHPPPPALPLCPAGGVLHLPRPRANEGTEVREAARKAGLPLPPHRLPAERPRSPPADRAVCRRRFARSPTWKSRHHRRLPGREGPMPFGEGGERAPALPAA